MKKIIVATGNKGKVKEIGEILSGFPCELISLGDLWNPLPEIDENGSTFLQNACIKADWVYSHSGMWALADDSGLEVDALNGAPGVTSARYAGLQCNAESNNKKLLDALKDVAMEKRTARFRCAVVLKTGIDCYISAEGVCEGIISFEFKGSGGFGYDPLFIPVNEDKSFAELPFEKKNAISHRGKALKILREKINGLSI